MRLAQSPVQTYIDSLASKSQLEMMQLQSLMNKYNNSMEMMSNLLKKTSDVKNSIIGNMR